MRKILLITKPLGNFKMLVFAYCTIKKSVLLTSTLNSTSFFFHTTGPLKPLLFRSIRTMQDLQSCFVNENT